jgi:hypothetical protein
LDETDIKTGGLYVKQIVLQNVGEPHPNSWRSTIEQKTELLQASENSVSSLPSDYNCNIGCPWVSSLPAGPEDFGAAASVITWSSSLK